MLKLITRQEENSIFSHLAEVNEAQSSVSSRMKRISALDIKTDGSLKVKRCTLVITNCEASSNSKEKIKEDGEATSPCVTVLVTNDLEAETGSVDVPETLANAEDF